MLQPLIITYQRCALNSQFTAAVYCFECRLDAVHECRVQPRAKSYLRDRLEFNGQGVEETFFCLGLPKQANLALRAIRITLDEWQAMNG